MEANSFLNEECCFEREGWRNLYYELKDVKEETATKPALNIVAQAETASLLNDFYQFAENKCGGVKALLLHELATLYPHVWKGPIMSEFIGLEKQASCR